MKEYPPRPKPVGICKCGHEYTKHKLTDNEDRWCKGSWLQRNVLTYVIWLPMNIKRESCYDCMCPMYEQVKIIDRSTGNEIQNLREDKQ